MTDSSSRKSPQMPAADDTQGADPLAIAERALELAAKATPGEWEGDWASNAPVCKDQNGAFYLGREAWPIALKGRVNGYPEPGNGLAALALSQEDQSFIAFARTALPALAEAFKALHAKSAEAEERGRQAGLEEAAKYHEIKASIHARHALWMGQNRERYQGARIPGVEMSPMNGPLEDRTWAMD